MDASERKRLGSGVSCTLPPLEVMYHPWLGLGLGLGPYPDPNPNPNPNPDPTANQEHAFFTSDPGWAWEALLTG
eukprot:scaffold115750_cov30-Phaeocystis_antarctica.AAC.1